MHYPSLNHDLGETIDALRDSVRQFVLAEIAPIADETTAHLQSPWRRDW